MKFLKHHSPINFNRDWRSKSLDSQAYRSHLKCTGRYLPSLESKPNQSAFLKPFLNLEKRLEVFHSWLKSLAILDIFNTLASVGIVFAVASLIINQDERHEQDVLAAWQTITSASGQSGNGGRQEALEFLNSRPLRFPLFCREGGDEPSCFRQPAQSLAGLDIGLDDEADVKSPGIGAYLEGLQLPKAHLERAILRDADLERADLRGAYLNGANLQNAYLNGADLQGAQPVMANLQGASLLGANLQGASLLGANLQGANLYSANLQDTILMDAVYNDSTKFPPNFSPLGAIHIDDFAEKPEEDKRFHSWYQPEESDIPLR